jgi:hypothetical protein
VSILATFQFRVTDEVPLNAILRKVKRVSPLQFGDAHVIWTFYSECIAIVGCPRGDGSRQSFAHASGLSYAISTPASYIAT